MGDGCCRDEQQRRLATFVHLEPDLDAVTLDEVLPVRLARSHRPI
jgi:hypothetical protein